jgi:hypothetical protein
VVTRVCTCRRLVYITRFCAIASALLVSAATVESSLSAAAGPGIVPSVVEATVPAGLPPSTGVATGDQQASATQPLDSAQPPGGREQIPADIRTRSKVDPLIPKLDPSLTHDTLPFWTSGSSLSFGMQAAYAIEIPIARDWSHVNLLYAQPQLAIVLRNFRRTRFERIQLVNEGMLGGAVNPGGRVLGYTMLFRLEGRTRGNTKPLFDWGAGIVNTTINEHAYELGGNLQFTPQIGIGFEHFFSPQRAFVIEYRFLHMSNAGTVQPNFGFQASVLTVGFRWLRRPRSSPVPRE